jgi:hypothetical protein
MLFVPGIIPGYVPDTNKMNYYQRQAYLPGEASFTGAAGPSPASLSQGGPLYRPGGFGTGGTNWTGDPAQAQALQAGQQLAGLASQQAADFASRRAYPGMHGRIAAAQNPAQYLPQPETQAQEKPQTAGSIG